MKRYLIKNIFSGDYDGRFNLTKEINKAYRYSEDFFDIAKGIYRNASHKRFVRIEDDGKLTVME